MSLFRFNKRLIRGGAVLAAAAVVLVGCAVPSNGPSSSDVGPDTGEDIPSVKIALPGSISSLYVGQEAGILNYYLASIGQEGLLTLDADGNVQPALAESWEQVDEVTYEFTLRDDAKFQDGAEVSVDDVVFSLNQASDATVSPGLSYYYGGVERIAATGERTLEIVLTEPNDAFLKSMSSAGAAFVTSQEFWESHDGNIGTSESLVLGTGPYRVTEFVPDSHVTYERVDTWWGGTPKVERINVEFIADESTRLLAAQSGDVDLAFNVPVQQSKAWQDLPEMRVEHAPDLSYVGLYFNTTIEPFDDPKVREALAHAFDRSATVDSLLRGQGEVATAIMTPESLGTVYNGDAAREQLSGIPQYEFDLDRAAAALAESTQPDGFRTEMIVPATGPHLRQAALAFAENLGTIGVDLNVREVPIEEWLAAGSVDGGYGVNYMWYFSTLGDPGEVPGYLLGAGNPAGYENPEIADLLSQAGAETDTESRIGLLLEAERLQAHDVVHVPLWWGQSATAFKNNLGINDLSPYRFVTGWAAELYRAGT